MELEKKIINLSDPEAVRAQIATLAVEKGEAEIMQVLQKYDLDIVYQEIHHNGERVQVAFKCVYVGPKEPPGGH